MVRVCDKHAGVGLAGFLTLNPLTVKYSGADSCPTVGSTSSQNSNDPLPQERQCSRASPGNAERYSPEEEPPLSRLRLSQDSAESRIACLRPTACGTAAFVKISGRQKRFGISCCIYLKNRDLLKWNTCSTPAEPARECLFDRPLPGRWC
jgi:hypothetical protein